LFVFFLIYLTVLKFRYPTLLVVHFWGFFVQAADFQALAVLLPVPAYGVSWPSSLPRDRHVAGDEWIAG
jgi:hypothetical protein